MTLIVLFDDKFLASSAARNVGDYRKLEVWRRARAFSIRMRAMVDAMSPNERRRVGDQVVRAADSIRFNIVEGAGLNSDPQLAKHLLNSLGSANEVQDELDSLLETGSLPEPFHDLPGEISEIRAMLAVFHRRVAPKRKKRKGKRRGGTQKGES